MYVNRKCTLYLASTGFEAQVFKCFITDTKRSSAGKVGLNYQESAFVAIPGNSQLRFTSGKDFLIPEENILELDGSSEQGYSQSVRALNAAGALTIMSADYKDFGSAGMRHWELSCK